MGTRGWAVAGIPSGTITFLFTDIEGSTRLWETQTEAMRRALARHDELLRQAIEANRGYVFKTVGDAFCAAFATASEGLDAAVAAQRALAAEPWGVAGGIRVRMGLHSGIAEIRDNDYFGQTLNRAARLQGIGHGGQLLVSLVTEELLRDHLPDDLALNDIGEHRLKDLMHPERVFQVAGPGLATDFPPVKSLDARPNNLPVQPTPFLGREKELTRLAALLDDPVQRVVTLLGPGGTGKTRLALQAAANADRYEDGVWFVDLSSVDKPAFLFPVIVRSVGLRESASVLPLNQLKEFTAHRSLLFVLDNFEQIQGGPPYLVQLIAACPSVTFLVTSREALQIRGEQVFPVPPLSTPRLRASKTMGPKQLSQFEAVTLFLERARAVRPEFTVTLANAPVLAEICARLDGLPLAVELAAARVSLLEPEQILERLGHQLRFLSGGLEDLPPRQRTLKAAIDWSYRLLTPEERHLLDELSVFAGGAILEAIEAVCLQGDAEASPLELLSDLQAKSLVFRETSSGLVLFGLLASIREYAGERLSEDGTQEALCRAHAEYYLHEAETLVGRIHGPDGARALVRLEADFENQRAALDWYHAQDRPVEELRLAAALGRFWHCHGHVTVGQEHLQRALDASAGPPAVWEGSAWMWLGALERYRGNYALARRHLERALERLDEQGGPALAEGRYWMGVQLRLLGCGEEAKALFQQVIASTDGDHPLAGSALLGLGLIAWKEGKLESAEALFRQALLVAEASGDATLSAKALLNLAIVLDLAGRTRESLPLLEESRRLNEGLGETEVAVAVNNSLGVVKLKLGEASEARRSYARMAEQAQRLGSSRLQTLALAGVADALRQEGEFPGALEWAERASLLARRLEPGMEQGVCARALGEARLACGRFEEARLAFEQAMRLLASACEDEEMALAREGLEAVNLQLCGQARPPPVSDRAG